MTSVLEAPVRLQRSQERLLERVLGSLGADTTPQEPKDFGAVLLVEVLERRYRHARHIVFNARGRASVSMTACAPP